jgi:hypothetical protein
VIFVGVYLSVISYSNGNMAELINKKILFPLFGAYAKFLSFLFLICLRDNSFPCYFAYGVRSIYDLISS